jgi:hypothetical protein
MGFDDQSGLARYENVLLTALFFWVGFLQSFQELMLDRWEAEVFAYERGSLVRTTAAFRTTVLSLIIRGAGHIETIQVSQTSADVTGLFIAAIYLGNTVGSMLAYTRTDADAFHVETLQRKLAHPAVEHSLCALGEACARASTLRERRARRTHAINALFYGPHRYEPQHYTVHDARDDIHDTVRPRINVHGEEPRRPLIRTTLPTRRYRAAVAALGGASTGDESERGHGGAVAATRAGVDARVPSQTGTAHGGALVRQRRRQQQQQ